MQEKNKMNKNKIAKKEEGKKSCQKYCYNTCKASLNS